MVVDPVDISAILAANFDHGPDEANSLLGVNQNRGRTTKQSPNIDTDTSYPILDGRVPKHFQDYMLS